MMRGAVHYITYPFQGKGTSEISLCFITLNSYQLRGLLTKIYEHDLALHFGI